MRCDSLNNSEKKKLIEIKTHHYVADEWQQIKINFEEMKTSASERQSGIVYVM